MLINTNSLLFNHVNTAHGNAAFLYSIFVSLPYFYDHIIFVLTQSTLSSLSLFTSLVASTMSLAFAYTFLLFTIV